MVGSGSGSSLTGLGLNIVSHLPVKLSQEPQQCLRGLKRADFRGSVWTRRTGRAPRSQRGLTADQEREKQWSGRSDRRGDSALGWSEYTAGVQIRL